MCKVLKYEDPSPPPEIGNFPSAQPDHRLTNAQNNHRLVPARFARLAGLGAKQGTIRDATDDHGHALSQRVVTRGDEADQTVLAGTGGVGALPGLPHARPILRTVFLATLARPQSRREGSPGRGTAAVAITG